MKKILLLLAPDPAEGGAKPPAAALVDKSDAKEGDAAELVRLKREIEERDKTIKDRETRLSELEDQNRQLKTPPAPAPAKQPEKVKREWLNGVFD